MLIKRDRLLFRVMVTHDTDHDFHEKKRARFERDLADAGAKPTSLGSEPTSLEITLTDLDPAAYPFNDLYDFFAVFWDGGVRIMANGYFRGDGRRKAGKRLKNLHGGRTLLSRGFYELYHRKELARIYGTTGSREIREAVLVSLGKVEGIARSNKGVALIDSEKLIASFTDWAPVCRG